MRQKELETVFDLQFVLSIWTRFRNFLHFFISYMRMCC